MFFLFFYFHLLFNVACLMLNVHTGESTFCLVSNAEEESRNNKPWLEAVIQYKV